MKPTHENQSGEKFCFMPVHFRVNGQFIIYAICSLIDGRPTKTGRDEKKIFVKGLNQSEVKKYLNDMFWNDGITWRDNYEDVNAPLYIEHKEQAEIIARQLFPAFF